VPIVTAPNSGADAPSIAPRVKAEQVNLLFDHMRGMNAAALIIAAFLGLVTLPGIGYVAVVAWYIYFGAASLGREIVAVLFRRATIAVADAPRWRLAYDVGNIAAALGWGAAGIVLFSAGAPFVQLLLMAVLLGVSAAGATILSASYRAHLEFSLLALVPLFLRLLVNLTWLDLIAAAVLLILTGLLNIAAWRVHRQLLDGLRLRFSRADRAAEQAIEAAPGTEVATLPGEVEIQRQSDLLKLAQAIADSKAEEKRSGFANYDRLTDLPNRTLFMDRLAQALAKARRAKQRVALLYVDLDRFKSINESLGQAAGDRVLRVIAERLPGCVRDADTVARLGGNAFTVILEECQDLESITNVADRILAAVLEPIFLGNTEANLTCSIGISLYPSDGTEGETLLQNADKAMGRAKQQGRNRYQFFTQDMHAQAMLWLSRENALRKALSRAELLLHYQPQFDVKSGGAVGVEALVRWLDPDLGMIWPDQFIPLAEETGLIVPLGHWALKQACQQAREWRDRIKGPFHMAVNLSVGQFAMGDLADMVREALNDSGLPPEALQLEITESLVMSNVKTNIRALRELRGIGVRLALDDFGTGSSSLIYLKRFPVDVLKIDRAFVDDIATDAYDAAIVRSIIALGESLGLDVIAEGVETEVQLKKLKAEGCSVMQGYLFSPPLPAEECGKLFNGELDLAV
jgi:diguanylate cyclase (GGDEF)-like protein